MSSGTVKIRLKMGNNEIEYEGDPSFLEEGLVNLWEKAIATHGKTSRGATGHDGAHEAGGPEAMGDPRLSTNTIANRLGAKSGSDLAMAASARLGLAQGKQSFARKEILSEMKGGTTFHKGNMNGNLTKTLKALVRNGRLNLITKDTYALSADAKKDLQARLAS